MTSMLRVSNSESTIFPTFTIISYRVVIEYYWLLCKLDNHDAFKYVDCFILRGFSSFFGFKSYICNFNRRFPNFPFLNFPLLLFLETKWVLISSGQKFGAFMKNLNMIRKWLFDPESSKLLCNFRVCKGNKFTQHSFHLPWQKISRHQRPHCQKFTSKIRLPK